MKIYIVLLLVLIVLPALLEATPWWRRRRRPRPRPRPKPSQKMNSGHCVAWGDPHYTTFDGNRYDFMGTCNYILATDHCKTARNGRVGTFKVITNNVRCGRRVSCVQSVTVDIKGSKIALTNMRKAYQGTQHFTVKKIRTRSRRLLLVVRSNPAGLTVTWDGRRTVRVYLSKAYKSKVCGLCGNFDGKAANDFIMSNGKPTRNRNKFGNSWGFGKHCPAAPPVPKHPCDDNPQRKAIAEKDCYVIKSCNFQACKAAGVDTDELYKTCMYDVCADEADSPEESSCEAIREASQECKEKTGKTVSWGHLADRCENQDKCTKVKLFNSCKTKCCVFPFTLNGVKYNKCVKAPFGSWCSSKKVATTNSIGLCA